MARWSIRCSFWKTSTWKIFIVLVLFQVMMFTFYVSNMEGQLGILSRLVDKQEPVDVALGWDEHNTSYRGVNFSSLSCVAPDDVRFPDCREKLLYMQYFWNTEPCYHLYGAEGSPCSSLYYLSEVEHECPSVEWGEDIAIKLIKKNQEKAVIRSDLEGLYALMLDEYRFDWIKIRLKKNWKKWVNAAKELDEKGSLRVRTKRRIYIYLGFLRNALIDFGREAFKGGPLGELVQWSDLIASLYILGHDLNVSVDFNSTNNFLLEKGTCPDNSRDPDIIFTDLAGLETLEFLGFSHTWPRYRCKIRLLDSFGTEPQYNHPESNKSNNDFGMLGLQPKQFMTMFPHSPDNSFLGFVVGEPLSPEVKLKKKQIALLYTKQKVYMTVIPGMRKLVDYISLYFDVHATIADYTVTADQKHPKGSDPIVPEYIINHGLLNQTELSKLLAQTKLFVGVGFPFEGPAPLEALAHGAMFIQPKFDPPFHRENHFFFEDKPTIREVTSQNPYCEDFVGRPYVYTVDMSNNKDLIDAVNDIRKVDVVDPHLPYEYTFKGMLERVHAHVQYEDLCSGKQWPPLSALKLRISDDGESCKDNCKKQGLICESGFFHHINKENMLKDLYTRHSGRYCSSIKKVDDSYIAPSLNVAAKECQIQKDFLKFSCVDKAVGFKRFCPCREFERGQVAICPGCID